MAKASSKKPKSILTDSSFSFFKNYINNASPVGFETSGQKLWLEYLKPYVDSHFSDPYGSVKLVSTYGFKYSSHNFWPLVSNPTGDALLI